VIKAAIFDLDDTLYDQDNYYYAVCSGFASRYNFNADELMQHYRRLKGKTQDIFGDVLKAIDKYSAERQEDFFKEYSTVNTNLELFSDAKELVSWLKEKKIRTGIITNGVPEVQKNKIKALKAEEQFDSIVYGRNWGKEMEKPHPKPFLQIMEELECSSEEIIFVGDTLETDIQGAINAGIKKNFLLDRNDRYGQLNDIKIISTLTEMKQFFEI
jgi:putative hydrolase of the HAD superfamily